MLMNPISRLRREAGITQQALAARANTSQSAIAAYESGVKSPTWRTVQRFAESMGLEPVVSFTPRMSYADYQSLCFHRAVAEILKQDVGATRRRAKRHLKKLMTLHPHARELLNHWRKWLEFPRDDLIARMLDPGPFAREMRQVSPFAGLLGPHERVKILRQARSDYGS